MSNEKQYTISLKHSEIRELQLALLYHIDVILIPFYENLTKEQDYTPTQEVKHRIEVLQKILEYLNRTAGIYSDLD